MDELNKLVLTNCISFALGSILGWFKFFLDRKGKKMDSARESRIVIKDFRHEIAEITGRDQLLRKLDQSQKALKSERAKIDESLPARHKTRFKSLLEKYVGFTEKSLSLGVGRTPAELNESYKNMKSKVEKAKEQLVHCLDDILKVLGG